MTSVLSSGGFALSTGACDRGVVDPDMALVHDNNNGRIFDLRIEFYAVVGCSVYLVA